MSHPHALPGKLEYPLFHAGNALDDDLDFLRPGIVKLKDRRTVVTGTFLRPHPGRVFPAARPENDDIIKLVLIEINSMCFKTDF